MHNFRLTGPRDHILCLVKLVIRRNRTILLVACHLYRFWENCLLLVGAALVIATSKLLLLNLAQHRRVIEIFILPVLLPDIAYSRSSLSLHLGVASRQNDLLGQYCVILLAKCKLRLLCPWLWSNGVFLWQLVYLVFVAKSD